MKKLSFLFALMMASSVVVAGGVLPGQQLDDSTKTKQGVDKGLFGNPYMPGPEVSDCDYNKNKLWFNGSTKKWECKNDRTKTGKDF